MNSLVEADLCGLFFLNRSRRFSSQALMAVGKSRYLANYQSAFIENKPRVSRVKRR